MPSSAWSSDVCSSRSEEHTSELQSLTNLVCRLLLENTEFCLVRQPIMGFSHRAYTVFAHHFFIGMTSYTINHFIAYYSCMLDMCIFKHTCRNIGQGPYIMFAMTESTTRSIPDTFF